jgi:hypothetical protein
MLEVSISSTFAGYTDGISIKSSDMNLLRIKKPVAGVYTLRSNQQLETSYKLNTHFNKTKKKPELI